VWPHRDEDKCQRKANQDSVARRARYSWASKNLLSIGQLAKKGIHTSFTDQGASLWKLDDMGVKLIVGGATWDNGLCYLNGHAVVSAVASVSAKPDDSIMEWHARLGRVNVEDVSMIENHDLGERIHITDKKRSECAACREGKQTRSSKSQTDTSESAPTDEIWRCNWS
jgi:hypothetical protein